MQRKVVVSN